MLSRGSRPSAGRSSGTGVSERRRFLPDGEISVNPPDRHDSVPLIRSCLLGQLAHQGQFDRATRTPKPTAASIAPTCTQSRNRVRGVSSEAVRHDQRCRIPGGLLALSVIVGSWPDLTTYRTKNPQNQSNNREYDPDRIKNAKVEKHP